MRTSQARRQRFQQFKVGVVKAQADRRGASSGAAELGLVSAHRGASACELENTLPAFKKALKVGADMLEFDTHQDRRREIFVFHDKNVGGKEVRRMTRAQLAKRVGFFPPLLDELVSLAAGKAALDAELKNPGFERRLIAAMEGRFDPTSVSYKSFLSQVVKTCKKLQPEAMAGLLVKEGKADKILRRAEACGADFIGMEQKLLHTNLLDRAAAEGYGIQVWTVDDEPMLRACFQDPRIDTVVTNRPGFALAIRGELNDQIER